MKGAVLIIGSLLWDKKKHRIEWRKNRLLINKKIHVFAPICYGRESGIKENKNYTMVLSSNLEKNKKFGTAFLIPFKEQSIKTFEDILNEARKLSSAENSNENGDNKLCKGNKVKWCTIGIIFNPKLEKVKKDKLLEKLQQKIKDENGLKDYMEYCINGKEKSILSEKGEILINWLKTVNPKNQNKLNELDFILATCTKQNIKEYPKIKELREAISKDTRDYFFNNIMNGITTYQDREIIEQ